MGLEEEVFVRAGIGQGELDASHGVDDFGAELQKFQAYGIGDGLGQRRVFQGDAADTVDEDIGEGGEEQAELVGFVGVRAHAIGEQIELAVLDAVFHVAAWAIGAFVEFPGRDLMAIQGSDEEAAALFLKQAGMIPSMSGKGNCYDNAMVETVFKTIKSELVWRTSFLTRRQAEKAIHRYIDGFYNPTRRHSALGYISPIKFEAAMADTD